MTYKGNDLDLRPPRPTARARESAGPAVRAGNGTNGAGAPPVSTIAGPIAVDDAVLACCNCAYDVARFHASEDIRLEHLLHALTRVGAATEVLAELGIRVDTLRRETAVAIAAEMPAGSVEGDGMPHASAAFADVLRRAADQAARRRGRRPNVAHGHPPDAGCRRPATARALARYRRTRPEGGDCAK